MAETPLYKDKYLVIFQDRVEILNYFFPVPLSKVLKYDEILSVNRGKDLQLSLFDYKGWGMGVTNIWWALDIRRSPLFNSETANFSLVFNVHDTSIRKGCSCENPDTALKIIHHQMYGTPSQDPPKTTSTEATTTTPKETTTETSPKETTTATTPTVQTDA